MVREINTKAEFDALLAESNDKLVVVDFWAQWCAPCRAMAPVFEELANENPDVIFAKVNVSVNMETAQAADIRSIPAFHFYKNGEKVDSVQGSVPKSELETLVANNK
uniref:Thioredoxin n=1 Tax=Branchiostoma floridae TaxID=7739 RepID=C3Z6B9_BRAFL|eukprot:XP_002595942.1 hypothetical protein BRAFLDRAFT_268611 [Branchiostoma floridae]